MDNKISIIICTYNREDIIGKCLDALSIQSCSENNYEIVLVNNNSSDSTEQICLNFKNDNKDIDFNYFVETKQGLSAARNRGIKEAKYNLLAFIDDDAMACEGYAQEVIRFFNRNGTAVALGGKILPMYETVRPKWMSKYLEPLMSVIDLGDKDREFPKNKFPIGANMVFRKSVFNEIDGFNENLGRTGKNMLGGEEKDLFNRIKQRNGLIWYSPKPWVYHHVPDKRLTVEFVKKQALGIGFSEKIRTLNIGKAELFKSIFKEILKWGASIVLFLFYSLTFQFSKAGMIVRFRYWVSKGFFKKGI